MIERSTSRFGGLWRRFRPPLRRASSPRAILRRAGTNRRTLVPRLLLLTLLPSLVCSIALTLYLTNRHIDALTNAVNDKSHLLAMQVATLAAEPMFSGDRPELAHIASLVNQQPDVLAVEIMDADGKLLVRDGSAAEGGRDDASRLFTATEPIYSELLPRDAIGSVRVTVLLAPLRSAKRAQWVATGSVLMFLIALSALLSWWLAAWFSSPLRTLAKAVDKLGRGDLAARVSITDDGEIGTLQRGFNVTAAALEAGRRQLQERIDQATVELARKNTALAAASQAKTRFLAAASHDLRQPLHALTLFSAGLQHGEMDPERRGRIERLQECVEALDRLFSELLDISRIDAGTVKATNSVFSLDTLFVEVSQSFRPVAEQRELRLIARATPLWVRGDRTMLARVLNNLISNAIRYTCHGGVLLAARRRGNFVRIDVIDTGMGIPAADQQRVFEEFVQLADPADTQNRGLGLGLATVRRLCELMKVSLQLRSRVGHGSSFSLLLPLAKPLAKKACEQPVKAQLQGLRVLVIDDEPAILRGIHVLLESWGCALLTAESGTEALALLPRRHFVPDLVISDFRLRRGESGLQAIRDIRKQLEQPDLPALLVTGETAADRLREVANLGIPVLYKPVLPSDLREAIAAAISVAQVLA